MPGGDSLGLVQLLLKSGMPPALIQSLLRQAQAPQAQGSDPTDAALGASQGLVRSATKLTDDPTLGATGNSLAGLLGLVRGIQGDNPGQAIGGAASAGSGLASLAGYPGVSSALGAVGGPLTFAQGLANGDPLSSTIGGIQTASLASGALGGPTASGLVGDGLMGLYNLLPGAAEGAFGASAGAAAGAAGAETAGFAGLSAGALAAAPIAAVLMGGLYNGMTGLDMFDSLFGSPKTHAQKQGEEWQDANAQLPILQSRRIAGANTFDHLNEATDPESIQRLLKEAVTGVRANVEPVAWNASHRPSTMSGTVKLPDVSAWEAASPGLSGKNWASFLDLMDKGQASGLDTGGMTGPWNLYTKGSDTGDPATIDATIGNTNGNDYRTKLGNSQWHMGVTPEGSNEVQPDAAGAQTQEAQDLGNAVSGLAGDLGVDLKSKGGADYENFSPEQVKQYGFAPGNYGQTALNYLRSYDPNVVNNPNWNQYVQALGDPSSLGLLNLIPRTTGPATNQAPPQDWGSLNGSTA